MGTLKEDIKTQSDWIVKAFAADGFKLDHTIDSLIEVDRFFIANMKNGQPKKGGQKAWQQDNDYCRSNIYTLPCGLCKYPDKR